MSRHPTPTSPRAIRAQVSKNQWSLILTCVVGPLAEADGGDAARVGDDAVPGVGTGLDHHSDRGSQCITIKYTERLPEAGIAPSVGRVGDSYENALAETVTGPNNARSPTGAGRGAPLALLSMPPWNGSIGSTTGQSWSPSATSRLPKATDATTSCQSKLPWLRDSNTIAPAKPGAVQTTIQITHAVH